MKRFSNQTHGCFPSADSCMALISDDNISVIQRLAGVCCLVSLEKNIVNIFHMNKMKGSIICIFYFYKSSIGSNFSTDELLN